MNLMKKPIIFLLSISTLFSCNSLENNEQPLVFETSLIESLYGSLKSQFDIDFEKNHLNDLLQNVNIERLKNGLQIEKDFLFENFDCDCFDKMKISYSVKDRRFVLWVYEEYYDKDLDWCPESSFSYSFIIEENKITDLRHDFMAG